MKYTATLNGKQYEVELERIDAYEPMPRYGEAPAAAPAPVAAPAAPAAAAGSVEVTASVPGKVFKIEANAGASVKAGDPIVILEAMKMEIPVVSP